MDGKGKERGREVGKEEEQEGRKEFTNGSRIHMSVTRSMVYLLLLSLVLGPEFLECKSGHLYNSKPPT